MYRADTTEKVSKFYRAQMDRVSRLVALRRKVNDSYEGLRYIVPDHLGGTIRLVDTAGTTIDDIRYHAFGGTRSGGTAMPTDQLFTGQTMDSSTGLYFYGARYYDPLLGRFLAPDRAGPDLKNPQSLNKYSYVLNNPVRYTDPTGNRPWDGEPEDDGGAGGGGGDDGGGDWGGDAPTDGQEADTSAAGSLEAGGGGGSEDSGTPGSLGASLGDLLLGAWDVPTNMLAGALDTLSAGDKQVDAGDVYVTENASGAANLLLNVVGSDAFTLGNHVFAKGEMQESIYQHELGHVEQSRILGPAYLPAYVVADALIQIGNLVSRDPVNVHGAHPMEMWADATAGRSPEPLFR